MANMKILWQAIKDGDLVEMNKHLQKHYSSSYLVAVQPQGYPRCLVEFWYTRYGGRTPYDLDARIIIGDVIENGQYVAIDSAQEIAIYHAIQDYISDHPEIYPHDPEGPGAA